MSSDYIAHHGVLGMKWGIRRHQPYGKGGYERKGGARGKVVGEAKDKNKKGINLKKGAAIAGAAAGVGAAAYGGVKLAKSPKAAALFDQSIKGGKDKPNISPAEKITKETKNSIDNAQSVVRSAGKIRRMSNPQENRAKGLSDEELRKRINRINLERQYNDLTAQDTAKGYEVAAEVLSIAGSVASIAVSAATVYALTRNLK